MPENVVPVNDFTKGSVARRLLFHLVSTNNPGHYCMDVKMSRGNVIPLLNGSQLYSSHPKQKCTKIYPEETAPGPRPLPYMGKILTFDRKVVEDPFFYQNDRI